MAPRDRHWGQSLLLVPLPGARTPESQPQAEGVLGGGGLQVLWTEAPRRPAVGAHHIPVGVGGWVRGGVGGCWVPYDLIGRSGGAGGGRSPAGSPPPAPRRHPPPPAPALTWPPRAASPPACRPPPPSASLAPRRPGRPPSTPPPTQPGRGPPASRRLPGAVLAAPSPGGPAGRPAGPRSPRAPALPPGWLPGPGGERCGRPRMPSQGGRGAARGRCWSPRG